MFLTQLRLINRYAASLALAGLLAVCLVLLSGCQPKELNSAKIYIQTNDWQKALAQLELAVEIHPENAEARFLLGHAYGRFGRFKEMNTEFDKSLAISGDFAQDIEKEREHHWVINFNRANSAMDNQDLKKAQEYLITAISIDPSRFEAHKKLAVVYINLNRPEKAIRLYNKLLAKRPTDLDLLASAGNLYYSQKKYDRVIPILNRILEIDPTHRDALANLALVYEATSDPEQAEQAFQAAIEANPQDKDLIFLFGVHYYKRHLYEQAIQMFQQVLDMSPDDFEATFNIGNSYLSIAEEQRISLKQAKNGALNAERVQKLKAKAILNYKKAIPYLEQAAEMNAEQPVLWQNLGIAYINSGNRKKGEQALLKAEDLQLKAAR